MAYSVKEIFYTLQGEGRRVGRPAVFCRFAGCNLWSGREETEPSPSAGSAIRNSSGRTVRLGEIRYGIPISGQDRLAVASGAGRPTLVVLTGGESLLQVDTQLIGALHANGFEVAVETNGTLEAPEGIDWLCVSPKANAPWVLRKGDELKLAYPQKDLLPEAIVGCEFDHYLIQPIDEPDIDANTHSAIAYCQANTRWNLSLQTHKILRIRLQKFGVQSYIYLSLPC